MVRTRDKQISTLSHAAELLATFSAVAEKSRCTLERTGPSSELLVAQLARLAAFARHFTSLKLLSSDTHHYHRYPRRLLYFCSAVDRACASIWPPDLDCRPHCSFLNTRYRLRGLPAPAASKGRVDFLPSERATSAHM